MQTTAKGISAEPLLLWKILKQHIRIWPIQIISSRGEDRYQQQVHLCFRMHTMDSKWDRRLRKHVKISDRKWPFIMDSCYDNRQIGFLISLANTHQYISRGITSLQWVKWFKMHLTHWRLVMQICTNGHNKENTLKHYHLMAVSRLVSFVTVSGWGFSLNLGIAFVMGLFNCGSLGDGTPWLFGQARTIGWKKKKKKKT